MIWEAGWLIVIDLDFYDQFRGIESSVDWITKGGNNVSNRLICFPQGVCDNINIDSSKANKRCDGWQNIKKQILPGFYATNINSVGPKQETA